MSLKGGQAPIKAAACQRYGDKRSNVLFVDLGGATSAGGEVGLGRLRGALELDVASGAELQHAAAGLAHAFSVADREVLRAPIEW